MSRFFTREQVLFWESVVQDDLSEFLSLLPYVDVNRSDRLGRTALHRAVIYGAYRVLPKLLALPQLDTEIEDWRGERAIDLAKQWDLTKAENMIAARPRRFPQYYADKVSKVHLG